MALFLTLLAITAAAGAPPSPAADGTPFLQPDERGNRIPDFSNCGYGGGGVELPVVPVREKVAPLPGDAAAVIQAAIDKVSAMAIGRDGFRGAVLLARGTYRIASSVEIHASGVVLRGEGDAETGTTLIATGAGQRTLIEVAGSGNHRELKNTRRAIVDDYIPVGARSFHLNSTAGLKIGSRLIVYRPSTAEWIHALGMDRIPPSKVQKTKQWTAGSKDLEFDRVVTAIDGQKITLDAPIVCALDCRYGGGSVFEYDFPGRIEHVGVENIRGVSEFRSPTDEDHGWVFVGMQAIENGWVRNVTAEHFGFSAVRLSRGAKWITVGDCRCLDPISQISGGRRYSFDLDGGELTLWQRCFARNGRHDFVTGSLVAGPSAFVDCTAEQAHADAGPHHRWAVGILYDNVKTDGGLNARNRGNSGTGHGWAGANQVFWNCTAGEMICENPPTADNWAIGCTAKTHRGNGRWESVGEPVTPSSLYRAQLAARLGNTP